MEAVDEDEVGRAASELVEGSNSQSLRTASRTNRFASRMAVSRESPGMAWVVGSEFFSLEGVWDGGSRSVWSARTRFVAGSGRGTEIPLDHQ